MAAVVPDSARSERRCANPPAAALLTGQAVRELAPARERLRLVCSLFWSAWTVWNVVQEIAINGGLRGVGRDDLCR
ncbi:hypothetical protein [Rhizobium leguminosarum]|uniref:hypothetical protein n=1 Tax=Rhizobium leguminosarum TaxID=384 RepID=UPI001FE16032|nr:hypothetical protein [Rhizobium leguminosarum]